MQQPPAKTAPSPGASAGATGLGHASLESAQQRSLAHQIFRPHWRGGRRPPWEETKLCCVDCCCKLLCAAVITVVILAYMQYHNDIQRLEHATHQDEKAAEAHGLRDVDQLAAVRKPSDLAPFTGTDPELPLALAVRGVVCPRICCFSTERSIGYTLSLHVWSPMAGV